MKQVLKAINTNGTITVIVEYNEKTDKYHFSIINRVLDGKKHTIEKFDSFQKAWEEATLSLF